MTLVLLLILIGFISYLIDNTICYLTLTEKTYPKRLAFLFLEDIAKEFVSELQEEHGDE